MNGIWKKYGTNYPPLDKDMNCCAAVVGGGLTGVILAYLLSKRGIDTVLFEEKNIASGKTSRSTAKVTLAHGYKYAEMAEKISAEAARKYAAANLAGLAFYRDHLPAEQSREMYLYALYGDRRLRREFAVMRECGINCELTDGENTPLPFKTTSSIKLPGQYEMDPVEFAHRLCWDGTFKVYEGSHAEIIGPHTLVACGHKITAENIILCTNYPTDVPEFAAPIKLSRKTSCAVKMTNPLGFPIPHGIIAYGSDGGYGYRHAREENSIIVSGETSRGSPTPNAIERLVSSVRQFSPDAYVSETWINNDTYTHDAIPYAGQLRSGIYVACGYSAWGMTNSASAAIILSEQICGREVWYADIFAPERNFMRGGSAEFTEHISTSVGGFVKQLSPPPDVAAKEIKSGSAAVVNYRGKRAGAYRDNKGVVHMVSLRCPHLGCELQWDPDEKTWDCPCHGSRFNYKGECISNPAAKSIRLN